MHFLLLRIERSRMKRDLAETEDTEPQKLACLLQIASQAGHWALLLCPGIIHESFFPLTWVRLFCIISDQQSDTQELL